jgi:hypothetical protein
MKAPAVVLEAPIVSLAHLAICLSIFAAEDGVKPPDDVGYEYTHAFDDWV